MIRGGRPIVLAVLAILPLSAEVVPVDLPPPADKPAAKDKPVKVYILSGQSNMLGFGRVEGATPFYSNVFLSADPSVVECKFPVDNAALLRFGVHEKTTLPATGGDRILGMKAFIEVPYDGSYRINAAGAEVVKVDGSVIEAGGSVKLAKGTRHELSLTYPKGGGSASLWLEKTDLEGMGDLRWVVEKLGRFPCMIDDKGEWTVRPDVTLCDAYMGKGKSDPLSAPACGPTFGPELGFGFVMGHFHDEPVIVMKADIGNRSLGWDILPPGSERYTFEGKEYPGYGETVDADGKVVKFTGEGWYAGKQYDDYTASIRGVLDNFKEKYPDYADQGFEVAGFVWWQGHKDGPNPAHNARYEQNLVNLIKAWRKEFNAPNAKWAIATVGFHGEDMPEHYVKIAEAQLAVADPQRHPELAGTVKTIDTRPFWREAEVSPKNQDYHYNHNAETYMLTGDALGRAMVEMEGGKVEYPPGEMDPSIVAIPNLAPPTPEQLDAMRGALRPIVLGKLIPEYVAGAPGTPAYRRNGIDLVDIVGEKLPQKPTAQLTSQLDKVIEYYELAGIDDYSWKRSGPEMQTAEWHYLTFDPAEKKDSPEGNRYREVTLPEGCAEWTSAGFDPAKAGWMSGKAPFGQNDGKLEPLRANCGNPHCGCDLKPNTLWDKEVLLMRQTFDMPEFDDGKRYRIVVGGAGHAWSGEGFALHVNGTQVAEMTEGYYKGGGATRGAFVFEDLKKEIDGGKATIAVKAFLRRNGFRNKAAPPSGHLSVWLEEATLPPTVVGLKKE